VLLTVLREADVLDRRQTKNCVETGIGRPVLDSADDDAEPVAGERFGRGSIAVTS
jgi:hypothetical protein